MKKEVHLEYFAILREQVGVAKESLQTSAATAEELYQELKSKYSLTLPSSQIRLAINDSFVELQSPLRENDQIIFLPPVAGG